MLNFMKMRHACHCNLKQTGKVVNIQGGPKNGPFLKVYNVFYIMTQEGILYIEMFSSLSGVRLIF